MKIDILIMTLLIILLIGVREAYSLSYWVKKRNVSNMWHGIGFLIRAFLCMLAYKFGGWIGFGIAVLLASVVYDLLCNLGLEQKWWYVGSTSNFDRIRNKLYKAFIKFLFNNYCGVYVWETKGLVRKLTKRKWASAVKMGWKFFLYIILWSPGHIYQQLTYGTAWLEWWDGIYVLLAIPQLLAGFSMVIVKEYYRINNLKLE